jgi:hypothetical protein
MMEEHRKTNNQWNHNQTYHQADYQQQFDHNNHHNMTYAPH